jgi:small subunit ribosomal protein S4e
MTHLKRQKAPSKWPIPRKGSAYIVRPLSDSRRGIPVLIVLRDLLKAAQNRREAKRAIHLREILVNSRVPRDEKKSLLLFDTLSIVPQKKHYRMEISKRGKFEVKEIGEGESTYKISKVVDKKILRGKKVQLNLGDGRNYLSDIKCGTNDSVLINLKENKIEKCLPLKENSRAVIFEGKHSGEEGIIRKIDREKSTAELECGDSAFSVLIKQLMVVG